MTVNGLLGLWWWGLRTESRFLKRVTEDEPQLIDLNTAPRVLTDGEGELIFSVLWSYVKDNLVQPIYNSKFGG